MTVRTSCSPRQRWESTAPTAFIAIAVTAARTPSTGVSVVAAPTIASTPITPMAAPAAARSVGWTPVRAQAAAIIATGAAAMMLEAIEEGSSSAAR